MQKDKILVYQKLVSDFGYQTQIQVKLLGVKLYVQEIPSLGIRRSTNRVQIYPVSDSASSDSESSSKSKRIPFGIRFLNQVVITLNC